MANCGQWSFYDLGTRATIQLPMTTACNKSTNTNTSIAILTVIIAVVHAIYALPSATADPITDRNYSLDLHQGVVLGSGRLVSMAGAGVSSSLGTEGMSQNPAAATIRHETDNHHLIFLWHLDRLRTDLGDDIHNSGQSAQGGFKEKLETGGIGLIIGKWAIAISLTNDTASTFDGFTANTQRGDLVVGRTFWKDQIGAAIGLRFGTLKLTALSSDLFEQTGSSLETGAIFKPSNKSFRIGGSLQLPVTGKQIKNQSCDPTNCVGYILPNRIALPAHGRAGVSYRFAAKPWNIKEEQEFRDERYVLLAFDVAISSAVAGGVGLGAFIEQQNRPSGQHTTPSFHLGSESEVVSGLLRLRMGTYWEGARVTDTKGRLHFTSGFDLRMFQLPLFGKNYRVKLSATLDIARGYQNYGVSLGFWR